MPPRRRRVLDREADAARLDAEQFLQKLRQDVTDAEKSLTKKRELLNETVLAYIERGVLVVTEAADAADYNEATVSRMRTAANRRKAAQTKTAGTDG
ncbi:hypothetical protein [Streptomyces sp. cg36]|uniref:hypothetical protein n=1 Tax=Streptomyces sp. cg36 TaxID=3238798 RepID=UPI0034E21D19